MAFGLIYYTQTVDHDHGAYKINIYQNIGETEAEEIMLQSDITLVRGSSSVKNKYDNLHLPTYVEFVLWDENKTIYDLLKDEDETEFKIEVVKDSTTIFTGFPSVMLDRTKLNVDNPLVRIRAYDGLKRLKDFKAKELTLGVQPMGDVLIEIINQLGFGSTIAHYGKLRQGIDTTKASHYIGSMRIYVEDYLATGGIDLDCYELLMHICKQHHWQIFQFENEFILRQIETYEHVQSILLNGIYLEKITSAGVYSNNSGNKLDMDKAVALSNFVGDPFTFKYDKIDQFTIKHNCYNPDDVPALKEETEQLTWVNGFFKEGSTGWTTISGSPVYREDGVEVPYGAQIDQTSGNLLSGEKIIIKVSSTVVRMILSLPQTIQNYYDNKMCMIKYLGSSTTYWWNFIDQRWDAYNDNRHIRGEPMLGYYDGGYLKRYDRITIEVDIDTTLPAENGNIVIQLYGGKAATGNNYPFEKTAFHNFAYVRKKNENASEYSSPNELRYVCGIASPKQKRTEEILFADYNPYTGVTLWKRNYDPPYDEYLKPLDDYFPDGDFLIETLVKRALKFNRKTKGFDVNIKPGFALDFMDVVEGDLDGDGTTWFLIMYEKTELIKDHKRFVMLEHNNQSPSTTYHTEFVFPDN